MTPEEKDLALDAYLWDPAAAPHAGVVSLERALAGASFDPRAVPLDLTALPDRVAPRRSFARPAIAFAIAASLLVAAGFGLWTWRWSWPDGRAWNLRAGGSSVSLEIGQPVTAPAAGIANIARIGQMRVGAGTAMELRATRGTRHRVRLDRGEMHVRLWAPPGSLVIETPAGEVIDLGCEFLLSVDQGVSRVRVLSGWVQLENGLDETLVPEGASTEMSATFGPGVPVFDDAAAEFRDGVRAFEREPSLVQLDTALRHARARDVYTLLQLSDRHPDVAEPILRRAAALVPPPDGITVASIVRGNRSNLGQWSRTLGLPSPKSGWWNNWRDGLPFWLIGR